MWKGGFLPLVSMREVGDRNIAIIAVEKAAKKQRTDIIAEINALNSQFYSTNTKSGDEADRGYGESALHSNLAMLTTLQRNLLRINAFIDVLRDYDGCCQNKACGEDVPLSRVMNTFSPLCVECAQ